jgi:hypothetical protein
MFRFIGRLESDRCGGSTAEGDGVDTVVVRLAKVSWSEAEQGVISCTGVNGLPGGDQERCV